MHVDMTPDAQAECGAPALRLGVVPLAVRPGHVAPALMYAFARLDDGLTEDAPLGHGLELGRPAFERREASSLLSFGEVLGSS